MDQQDSNEYLEQLKKVETALLVTTNGEDYKNLLTLQNNLKQLISLANVPTKESSDHSPDNEYALFMAEMAKEDAIEPKPTNSNEHLFEQIKSMEGMKCKAPYNHSWGDSMYHNAMITSIMPMEDENDEINVKILFINPTFKDMLTCPYLLESKCKFTDDQCRYSHGKIVQFSSLQEYEEPDFASLDIGSFVLAKKNDKLWHKGTVKKMLQEKCIVKLESNNIEETFEFCDIFPLDNKMNDESDSSTSDSDAVLDDQDYFINKSLLTTPSNGKLGEWEMYTKGIGSKLMEKMGYVIGTGLGKLSEGRIEPVTAEVLPTGKSLDHCMELRNRAGGDKNLFNVERKLKRLQRRQELRNAKNYARESKKVDLFDFVNKTCSIKSNSTTEQNHELIKLDNRQELKKESCRNLNVESLKLEQNIKEVERTLQKIKQSMQRNTNVNTVNKLKNMYRDKQQQLEELKTKLRNIINEQSLRSTTRKLTVF